MPTGFSTAVSNLRMCSRSSTRKRCKTWLATCLSLPRNVAAWRGVLQEGRHLVRRRRAFRDDMLEWSSVGDSMSSCRARRSLSAVQTCNLLLSLDAVRRPEFQDVLTFRILHSSLSRSSSAERERGREGCPGTEYYNF